MSVGDWSLVRIQTRVRQLLKLGKYTRCSACYTEYILWGVPSLLIRRGLLSSHSRKTTLIPSPLDLSPHTNASSGIQNVTKKLKDPELTQKVTASAAWGWGAISTQAGTLWSKAAETVGAIGEG